jgi:hypothetical protein
MFLKELPPECQQILQAVRADQIEQIHLLRHGDEHSVYRINSETGDLVLKYFYGSIPSKELQVYELLQNQQVPTLPCYGMTDHCILLEDLQSSKTWRLANPTDMNLAATGDALVHWYKKLHAVGFDYLRRIDKLPQFLQSWVETISKGALNKIASDLGLGHTTGWNLVLANCEWMVEAYLSHPQTFNYNDFAADNLALSRYPQVLLKAIVFDYDQFSSGTVYSDWRNITYSLGGEALVTFVKNFGAVSDNERRLDEVLNVLYGLIIASKRKRFPKWAVPLRQSIFNGDLESKIHAAIETI